MIRYFMGGTRYARAEREMMSAPNYKSRKSGKHIYRRFRYTPENVDCALCTECDGKRCGSAPCPWIEERIEAGLLSHIPPRMEGTAEDYLRILKRVENLTADNMELFASPDHRARFNSALAIMCLSAKSICPRHLASVYLLTASRHLWVIAGSAVGKNDIKWQYIAPGDLNLEDYTLLQAAKGISQNKSRVSVEELADPQLISDEIFALIYKALLIARDGSKTLDDEKETEKVA